MNLKAIIISAMLFSFCQPALALPKVSKVARHKVFHYGVVWPLRVVGFVIAAPITVPTTLAERYDTKLEHELEAQATQWRLVAPNLLNVPTTQSNAAPAGGK